MLSDKTKIAKYKYLEIVLNVITRVNVLSSTASLTFLCACQCYTNIEMHKPSRDYLSCCCCFSLPLLTSQQQGASHAFYRIIFSRRYSNDIQCFILCFSKKCILLMGEAECAKNTMHSYLKAAKRGKPDMFERPTELCKQVQG